MERINSTADQVEFILNSIPSHNPKIIENSISKKLSLYFATRVQTFTLPTSVQSASGYFLTLSYISSFAYIF